MTTEDAIRALEICQAKVDVLHTALSGVVRIFDDVGGFLKPEHQVALAAGVDALGIRPRTKTWRNR